MCGARAMGVIICVHVDLQHTQEGIDEDRGYWSGIFTLSILGDSGVTGGPRWIMETI